MSEKVKRKLKDIGCEFISGFGFKSSDYTSSGIPLIKIGNIQNRIVSVDVNGTYVSEHIINEKIKQVFLANNDVLIAMTGQGSVGRVGRLKLRNNDKALLNQRVGKFICDEKNINIDYLYYVLTSDKYQDYLFNTGAGSGQPNLSPALILQTEIPWWKYEIQKAIAEVLSSLDDKIDLLHRQNKTLEQMAETLFRQWFVEEADESWEVGVLSDFIKIGSGKGLKKDKFIKDGEYPILGANGEIGRTNNYLFDEKLIFTGRVGTLGNVFRVEDKKVWLSDNTLIIRPKKYYNYIYFILKNAKLGQYNVGSTQPLVRQSDVKEIEILITKETLHTSFEEQSELYFKKINKNQSQIRTLEKMRDTLLPKLMSGEVRVKI